jgi:hypothetical protein
LRLSSALGGGQRKSVRPTRTATGTQHRHKFGFGVGDDIDVRLCEVEHYSGKPKKNATTEDLHPFRNGALWLRRTFVTDLPFVI